MTAAPPHTIELLAFFRTFYGYPQPIKIFTHLARSLHFGRTSRACNLTPSALTRTIQRIEEELGPTLFQRDKPTGCPDPGRRDLSALRRGGQLRWQDLQRELACRHEPCAARFPSSAR
jgi:DNA-binding transcriptional LysR family regulator